MTDQPYCSADAHEIEQDTCVPFYWYHQIPPDLATKKQLLLRGFRPATEAQGKARFVIDHPVIDYRHASSSPFTAGEIKGIKRTIEVNRLDFITEMRLENTGHILTANLYRIDQAQHITDWTEREARVVVEHLFRPWSSDPFIVEYQKDGHKAVATVGKSVRPEWITQKDLWRDHLIGKRPMGPCNQGEASNWFAFDLDRHRGTVHTKTLIEQSRELHTLLSEMGVKFLVQVNPKNGSHHYWCQVPDGNWHQIVRLARERMPWLDEVYPDNKTEMILPLRPDKILLLDDHCPKTSLWTIRWVRRKKRRVTHHVYSNVYFLDWFNDGSNPSWDLVEATLQGACRQLPDLDVDQEVATKEKLPRRSSGQGRGNLGPVKGRYLKLLVDYYVNGVVPPDNTIGTIEAMIIRHARVGKGMDAEETQELLERLRARLKDKSFSDRLSDCPEELDRTNAFLLRNPLAYQPDPEASKDIWLKVEAHCRKIAFDLANPDTWHVAQPRLKDVRLDEQHVVDVSVILSADHDQARRFMVKLLNFIEKRSECAYKIIAGLLESVGLAGTNRRIAALLKYLLMSEVLVKVRDYLVSDEGWRHGNFYILGEQVRICSDQGGEEEVPTPISLKLFTPEEGDDEQALDLLMDARRLRADELYWATIEGRRGKMAA